jgi:hypothetical protein
MDVPKPFPSAITTCLMLAGIGVTGLSQAGVPDQETVGVHAPDTLIANETNHNNVKYHKVVAGGATTIKASRITTTPPDQLTLVKTIWRRGTMHLNL